MQPFDPLMHPSIRGIHPCITLHPSLQSSLHAAIPFMHSCTIHPSIQKIHHCSHHFSHPSMEPFDSCTHAIHPSEESIIASITSAIHSCSHLIHALMYRSRHPSLHSSINATIRIHPAPCHTCHIYPPKGHCPSAYPHAHASIRRPIHDGLQLL